MDEERVLLESCGHDCSSDYGFEINITLHVILSTVTAQTFRLNIQVHKFSVALHPSRPDGSNRQYLN